MSTRSRTSARERVAASILDGAHQQPAAVAAVAATSGSNPHHQEGDADEPDPVVDTAVMQAAMLTDVVRAEIDRRVAEEITAAVARAVAQQPGQAPQVSPLASPQLSPVGSPRVQLREPRLNELPTYDGAQGQKLDEWLATLRRLAGYYDLDAGRSVKYAVVHFTGAADAWWTSLSVEVRSTITDEATLAAALRARFQPVTAANTARTELYRLEQGNRGVDAYIADFQRLTALVPAMTEAEKLFLFERGLRRDLAEKLRIQGVTTLEAAIALAARVGNLIDAAGSGRSFGASSTHPARVHQMEDVEAPFASVDRVARLEASLHAMQSSGGGGFMGLGAKTQTHRGYKEQGGSAGAAGRGGRGGRDSASSFRPPRPAPQIPGVAPEVVQQRWNDRLCLRCGEDGHMAMACPNSIKSAN